MKKEYIEIIEFELSSNVGELFRAILICSLLFIPSGKKRLTFAT